MRCRFDFRYAKEPNDCDLELKSALRLASQVVCQFGKSTIEDIIKAAVPNNKIKPGPLHFQLVDLGWTDIFTTNYDTLLEAANTKNRYTPVTNKDTLLYASQPRIIKLHGSFPDVTPFIIDEGDYRTYPTKFPEFVNTVRQSLIESVLCLIGFSGDDPNFLSWIGWIRDVMGAEKLSPIYMFDVSDTEMHPSEITLFKKRGIEVIPMTSIFNGNIQEYFEFIFQFLKEDSDNTDSWECSVVSILNQVKCFSSEHGKTYIKIDSTKFKSLIDAYHNIRESYPGWLFIPKHILKSSFEYSVFQEIDEIKSLIKDVPEHLIIDLLYELDWRINMAFIPPTTINWFIDKLESLLEPLSDKAILDDYRLTSLANTLLSHYRLRFLSEKFNILKDKISKITTSSDTDNIRKYYYECCLMEVSALNYQNVRKILEVWEPASADYLGILWKNAILTEIGEFTEAYSLLTKAKQQLENFDINYKRSDVVNSVRGALMSNITMFEQLSSNRTINQPDIAQFRVSEYFSYVESKLREAISNRESHKDEHEHGFNLEHVTIHHTIGKSSNNKEGLFAVRLQMIRELFGFPFRIGACSIDSTLFRISCDSLFEEGYYTIALNSLIRACQLDTNKAILRKSSIMNVPKEWAENWVDIFLSKAERIKTWDNNDMETLRLRVITLLILPRFSVILDSDRNIRIAKLLLTLYSTKTRDYKNEYLKTVYNCLPIEKRYELIPYIAQCPLSNKDQSEIYLPQVEKRTLNIPELAINIILQGLTASTQNERNAAYRRSTIIYPFCSDAQKAILSDAIRAWRNIDMLLDIDATYSFNMIDYKTTETYSPNTRIEYALDKLSKFEVIKDEDDGIIGYSQEPSEPLSILKALASRLSKDQSIRLLSYIIPILDSILDSYKHETGDLSLFFGKSKGPDFDAISYIIIHMPKEYINQQTMRSLEQIYNNFAEEGYPKYFVIERFNPRSKILNNDYIEEMIFSANEEDRRAALMYKFSKEVKPKSELWKNIFNKLRFSDSTDVSDYLSAIIDGLKNIRPENVDKYRFEHIFNEMAKKIKDTAIPIDYRYDIAYNTKKLAGYISNFIDLPVAIIQSLSIWRTGSEMDKSLPNDVIFGYEEGVALWTEHRKKIDYAL